MRTFLSLLTLTLLLAYGNSQTLLAQNGGGWNADPEQRATQQTALMTEKLALSDAQALKVKEINLKYANQMKDAREKANGDRDAMRAAMAPIREAQDKEMQTVLTEEQWAQWTKFREEQRGNRGNFGGPGGPGGDKKDNKDNKNAPEAPKQ